MPAFRSLLVALAATALAVTAAEAQRRATITGSVKDPYGQAVAFARVDGARRGLFVADVEGAFRATVEPGEVTLVVRRIGFVPDTVTLMVAADTSVAITLQPVVTQLGTVAVNATRNDPLARQGFYERVHDRERGLNNGTFVFPEEIEARQPHRITQMLTKAPGIRLANVSGAAVPVTSANCVMTVYLDGMRLQTIGNSVAGGSSSAPSLRMGSGGRMSRGEATDQSIDAIIPATQVAAIEIYPRGANAPQRYQMLNGTCGIIAFWTRSGRQEGETP